PGPDPYGATPGYPGYQQGQPGYQQGQPGYQQGQPGAPGGPFPPAPPKKSNKTMITVIVAIGVVLILGACVGICLGPFAAMDRLRDSLEDSQGFDPPEITSVPETPGLPGGDTGNSGSSQTVVYELSGSGRVALSYTDQSGKPTHGSSVDLPWKKEVKIPANLPKILTAIRIGNGSGDITCKVTIDGQQVATKTGSGDFATVTCSRFSTG
ncbi:hypothetical protein I0C86_03275, partial [Plantactinospora sp. S1510]